MGDPRSALRPRVLAGALLSFCFPYPVADLLAMHYRMAWSVAEADLPSLKLTTMTVISSPMGDRLTFSDDLQLHPRNQLRIVEV